MDTVTPSPIDSAVHFLLASNLGLIFPISFSSLALALSLSFFALLIYRLFLSPLAPIPGPWYAAVSDLWIISHVVRLQQCKTIQSLFDDYGPVVRIGPNKLAFCDTTSMKSVYCIHKFDKSDYYKSLLTNNNDHAMTTLPHAEHSARRKGYASHYNMSHLVLFQPEIHDNTLNLVDMLDRIAGKTSIDCLDLFRHYMVDVIANTVFGSLPGSLDKLASNIQDPISLAIYDFPKRGILRSAVPSWAWNLVCQFPNARFRKICQSDSIMAEFVGSKLYELRAKMQAGKLDLDSEKMPLVQRMLQYRPPSTNQPISDRDIISEVMGHLVAGVDTTSTTFSYLAYELSRRPDVMSRLQAELDDAMPDRRVIPDVSVLSILPYLNAVIKEGLRLFGAAPSLLERVVPSRGSTSVSKLDDDFDLMGYALPPGTVVSTQSWSTQRDAEVFPSPNAFLPERWLAVDGSLMEEERLFRMSQNMMPFGLGTRACGGQNLAQIVLKVLLATMARNFAITANALETNEQTMEIRDAFVIFPASLECKLSFHHRPQ